MGRRDSVFTVDLVRDGLDAPWGFRLKGGRDVDGGTPFEVIKISIGSAAEGILKVGDNILSINHRDAAKLTHADAQHIFQRAGTTCQLVVSRPNASYPFYQATEASQYRSPTPPRSRDMWDGSQPRQHTMPIQGGNNPTIGAGGAYSYRAPPQQNYQPFRTTQLVFPGAKSVYYQDRQNNLNAKDTSSLPLPVPYGGVKYPTSNSNINANEIPEAVTKQPYRTTPLVLPGAKAVLGLNQKSYMCSTHQEEEKPFRTLAIKNPEPRTIHDVKNTIREKLLSTTAPPLFENTNNLEGGFMYQHPHAPPQAKTVEIDGVKKKVVTQQFNSPLNLYSDEAIADAVVKNKNAGLGAAPTHPGYVDERPHLPLPKDATFSRPHQSETFKLILESEMDKARDQKGIVGKEFRNQDHHQQRPGSSLSNKSAPPDPVLLDSSISQSTSFKRIMQAVLQEPEYHDPQ